MITMKMVTVKRLAKFHLDYMVIVSLLLYFFIKKYLFILQEGQEKEENQAPETDKDKDGDANEIDPTEEPETESASQEPEVDEPQPEEKKEEELPNNPDKIDENDQVDEKKQEAKPQANPSTNDPSAGEKAENAEMERGTEDIVETNAEQKKDEEAAPFVSNTKSISLASQSVSSLKLLCM